MNITRIILMNACLALAATGLAAQDPGHPMGMGPGAPYAGHDHPMAGLNLSDAQKAGMKAIHDKHQAALEAKGKAARDARHALRAAMSDPAVDDAQLKVMQAQAAEAEGSAMLERRAMMRESQALLTPEQKAAWAKARPQGGPGRGHGMGHGCFPG